MGSRYSRKHRFTGSVPCKCERAISALGVSFFLPSSVASHFNELLAPLQRFRPGQELGFDDTEMGPVCGAKLHAWIVIVSVRRKSGHMPELVARRLRLRPLPEVRLRFTPSCQPFFGTYGV